MANKIQKITSSFETKDIKQREALSEMYRIQNEQKKIEREMVKLNEKRETLSIAIKKSLSELDALQSKMRDLKTLISMRLRVSGQIVDSSMKDIVLLSKNPSEIERLLKGLSFLLKKDIILVNELRDKKEQYTLVQNKTTETIKELTANKQVQQLKADKLAALKVQKNAYIAKIQKDKKNYLNLLTELRKAGKESLLSNPDSGLVAVIRKSFFEHKKQLEPPVQGRIVQDFGAFELDGHVKLYSKGIYFGVDEPREISSVAYGKVAFVGDIKDYKNTVVLDHGNHYYTVYAFLRDVTVKVGQEVDKKQSLGKVGYNPYMNINGIYFEIRHFSDPLNPKDWFVGSTKAISNNKSIKGDTL